MQRALLLLLLGMFLGGALATGPFDAFIQQAATLANGLTGSLVFCPQGLPCQDVKTAAIASVKLTFAVYPWNAWEKPLLVMKPASVADIQLGLAFALQHELEVAVTSGGHGPGNSGRLGGGFLISMANFKNVTVYAPSKTVVVQGGATVEAINNATAPFGLYVPMGQCYSVGQGFALNGGIGMTPRQVGLGSDSIMQLKVVLANGTYVTVNRKTTPDLFWAMRGAGPAFGIVVETKFRAYKTEGITGGHLVFLDFTKRAFTTALAMVPQLAKDPKVDFLLATGWNANPPAMLTIVQFLFSDNRTKAEQLALADSLIKLGPVINTLGNWGYFDPAIDFKAAVKAMEASPNLRHYWLSGGPPSLKENVWTKFAADYTTQIALKWNYTAAPFTNSLLHLMGGKVSRSNSPTGVWQQPVTFIMFASWNNSRLDSYNVDAMRAMHTSLAPFMKLQYAGEMTVVDPGVGPNLAALAGGANNVARLRSIKAVYDPTNVFKRHYLPGLLPAAAA